MTRECTEERFLKDVADHEMTIVRDEGVHRHIRFAKPGTSSMHFDLVTWPGYLCYSGDMGTYVFSRLRDMFEFFREKPSYRAGLYINEGYWAEKLQATDKPDCHRTYSAERFREYVIYNCRQWRHEMSRAEFRLFRAAIEEDVLRAQDDGEDAAYRALADFEHAGRQWFSDYWEASFKEYTFRFTWCCYALAWGIGLYDANRGALLQNIEATRGAA